MGELFELWSDGETGHVFAVRLEGDRVTGYCGPLILAEVRADESDAAADTSTPEPADQIIPEWRGEEARARLRPGQCMLAHAVRRVAARRRHTR